jgi:hypothetical protein
MWTKLRFVTLEALESADSYGATSKFGRWYYHPAVFISDGEQEEIVAISRETFTSEEAAKARASSFLIDWVEDMWLDEYTRQNLPIRRIAMKRVGHDQ